MWYNFSYLIILFFNKIMQLFVQFPNFKKHTIGFSIENIFEHMIGSRLTKMLTK